jgi:AraC-like DNA-binding protein
VNKDFFLLKIAKYLATISNTLKIFVKAYFLKNQLEILTFGDVTHKLNIPKSHLLYIFKYHASISFSDFKKIVRIQKIIVLIDEDFLKTNTMETLATTTGFSSYTTFFTSFKSIIGLSPQEYLKINRK